VIEDQNKKIIAVIQLKGRSQNRSELTATMSTIQMLELLRYHIYHEVPVALINIRYEDGGLRYEWLVLGKANIPPSPKLKQLIDPIKGVDPFIDRNTRSRAYASELHDRIISNRGVLDSKKELGKFQEFINEAQLEFQNLRFYKSVTTHIDVGNYWHGLMQTYKSKRKLTNLDKLSFDEFYQSWKEIVVLNQIKRIKNLSNNVKMMNEDEK
jgi:hypothetical protein